MCIVVRYSKVLVLRVISPRGRVCRNKPLTEQHPALSSVNNAVCSPSAVRVLSPSRHARTKQGTPPDPPKSRASSRGNARDIVP